jgi:hypothetical protein
MKGRVCKDILARIRSPKELLLRVLLVFVLSQCSIQLSCQHLHHCGVRLFSLSAWNAKVEEERLGRSLTFLESAKSVSPLIQDRKNLKICFAIVTVERKQRYVIQTVASLLFHALESDSSLRESSLVLLVAGFAESNKDAEFLTQAFKVPFLRVPKDGFCGHNKTRSFYEHKSEVYAFAVQSCQDRLADNGCNKHFK